MKYVVYIRNNNYHIDRYSDYKEMKFLFPNDKFKVVKLLECSSKRYLNKFKRNFEQSNNVVLL